MLRVLGSLLLSAALAAPPPPPPPPPPASAEGASAPTDEGVRRVVGVVTFEGSSEHAATLSRELSSALRQRGHWAKGGRSLQQVQEQLQCTDYAPACMAKAGELFESELVIYGTLRARGDVHQLEMFLLDAKRGEVQSHVSAAIPEYDLSDGSIHSKSVDLLAQLWPLPVEPQVGAAPLPPPPRVEPTPEDTEPGKLKWGRERPAKKWKYALLGTSAGLAGVGIVLAAVGGAKIRPGGPLEQQLFEEADESLIDVDENGDPNTENDIDRALGGDLCAVAESSPPGMPNVVTNSDVASVCRQARIWTGITTAGLVLTGVGLVGVATFTTLLFVHRQPGKRARVRPSPGGLAVRF